jgi:hypothetical protein
MNIMNRTARTSLAVTMAAAGLSLLVATPASALDLFDLDFQAKFRLNQLSITGAVDPSPPADATAVEQAFGRYNAIAGAYQQIFDDDDPSNANFSVVYSDTTQIATWQVYFQATQAYNTLRERACYWAEELPEDLQGAGMDDVNAALANLVNGSGIAAPGEFQLVSDTQVKNVLDEVADTMDRIRNAFSDLPDSSAPSFQFATSMFYQPLEDFQAEMADICDPPL